MKKTRKSLLSVLLTLVMLVGLVPALATEAHAAPWSDELRIGEGAMITTEGRVTSDYITAGTVSVAYTNFDTNYKIVVTLSNATIDLGEWLDSAAINYNGGDEIVINLVGDNQIITYDGDTGIFSYRSSITIIGTGTLSISSPGGNSVSTGDENQGIYLDESLRGAHSGTSLADAKSLLSSSFTRTYRLVVGNNGSSLSPYAYITGSSSGGAPVTREESMTPPAEPNANAFGNYPNRTVNETDGFELLSFDVDLANADGYTGKRPASAYSYSIEQVAKSVDSENWPVVRFAQNGSTKYTVNFTQNDGGSAEDKTVPLSISVPAETTEPGVYVYRITQEYLRSQYDAGFVDGDAYVGDTAVYSDYYLYLNVKALGNGVFKATQAILYNYDGEKQEGFDIEYSSSIPTYAVTLEKKSETGVDGTFEFSVRIDIPGSISAGALNVKADGEDVSFTSGNSVIVTVDVEVGSQIYITGLPEGTVVSVKEIGRQGDHSQTYNVTSYVANMSPSQNLTSGSEGTGYTTYGTVTGNGGIITYFNELADISLTGVSLRYAPYMAMMGAGLAVVGLSKTRRKEEEI